MNAIEFLRKSVTLNARIVSSNDLNNFQISEAQREKLFFVDDETGYGWAILPFELTTDKDRNREKSYFENQQKQVLLDSPN